MKINLKKWRNSMIVHMSLILLLGITMISLNYWKLISKEFLLLLILGFIITGIINLMKKSNHEN